MLISKINKTLQVINRNNQKFLHCFSTQNNENKQQKTQENLNQQEQQQQQQEQASQNQSGEQAQQSRRAKAQEEDEKLHSKRQQISWGWRAFKYAFWGNIALIGYNMYIDNKHSRNAHEQLGYTEFHYKQARKCNNKIQSWIDYLTKPPVKQLLPDMAFYPDGVDPPKTIVLNLSGTIIHSKYVFGSGHQAVKRPGLQKFLRSLKDFEVIILTDDEAFFARETAQQIDKARMIIFRCFGRESMVYDKGQYVKDLRYLGRDLSRVIVIDSNPKRLKYQPENGIFISEFTGDESDQELLKLLPFVQHLGNPRVKDVRNEIAKYGNSDPGTKFLQELQARKEVIQQKQKSVFGGILGSGQQQYNYASQKY